MKTIKLFIDNFIVLASDMGIYIIIGVLIAGVLKQIIPEDFVSKHLGNSTIGSVIKASLFGTPLPLCSCGVIPFASSLKKEGASSGAVMSFLISTPITGVDSIAATYSYFGWVFTTYRVVTSVIIAIVAGVLQNLFGENNIEKIETQGKNSCCASGNCQAESKKRFSIKQMIKYGIFEIFRDFAKPLFFGLLIGAAITTFVPKEFISAFGENRLLSYLLILAVAMPLYVCATASLPIAASLIAGGLSGGAAFIFLSAGPATNSVTMGVVLKSLGKKALIIYLGTIGLFSILSGYILDTFFRDISAKLIANHTEHTGVIATIGMMVMLGLIAYFLSENIYKKYKGTK
jgi:uncharacterized membrane protein YraQ (UPF0718 family)